jgi:hypothetical protein
MANRTDTIIDVISDAKQEAADIAQSIQHLIGLRDLLRGALVDVEHCVQTSMSAFTDAEIASAYCVDDVDTVRNDAEIASVADMLNWALNENDEVIDDADV